MDKAVLAALSRRDELAKEMAELDTFLAVYKRFGGETNAERRESDTHMSTPADTGSEASRGSHKVITATARVRKRTSPAHIAAMAERVIREMERPMNRVDLVEALEERDVEIPSADKLNYLGTTLWRHANDKLINLSGLGYWLRNLDYAPANYQAGSSDDDEEGELNPDEQRDAALDQHSSSAEEGPAPPPPPPEEETSSFEKWARQHVHRHSVRSVEDDEPEIMK